MSILRFAVEMFRRFPNLFIGNTVLALVLMAVDAATLVSIAPVISLLTQGGGTDAVSSTIILAVNFVGIEGGVEVYLSIFVVLTILNSIMLIVINYFIIRAQFVVRNDMVLGTSELIFFTSTSYINQQRQGDFINTLTEEVTRVSGAFTAMTRLIAPVAQVIILLSIPFLISPVVTAISMAAALSLMVPLRLFRKHVYCLGQDHTKYHNKFSAILQESLSNTRVITVFANENATLKKLAEAFSKLRDVSIKYQILSSSIQSAFAPIGIIVVFLTFIVGQQFGVALAEIGVILYAFNRLAGTLGNITSYKMQLVNQYPSYEQVMKIRREANAERLVFGAQSFNGIRDCIRLEGVSFEYAPATYALKDICLSIPAGKMTALVGASGSGKSTLADLILGVQQPTEGRILIDAQPMSNIDIGSFRKAVGYVPQHSTLLHASIRENIVWANEDASENEIFEACRLANTEQFIGEFEEGYDTIVGDRGVRLSGGQVQRIALARALVRKPQVLILDEASSALDSQSEKLIQASIEDIIGKTTIIAIAHRLSTIAKADNIVVLERGRVVEQGSFDELMARNGIFTKLAQLQKL